jgi:hypothetical protein
MLVQPAAENTTKAVINGARKGLDMSYFLNLRRWRYALAQAHLD